MYNDITGIILSGGKSKRMGLNKSFLRIGEQTVIERTVNLMKGLFKRVLLITNNPDEYNFLGLEIFKDVYKNVGPLAGIHSGLTHSVTNKNFIMSCDMPFVNEGVIEFILNYKTDSMITVAKADGFIQQLCGLYSNKLLPEIDTLIEEDFNGAAERDLQKKSGCKVLTLVNKINAEIIDVASEYEEYEEGTFLNMNSPEDFEIVKRLLTKV